jgi:cytochrome P450/NADPH-cytochrome P450 reductase
MTMTMEHHTTTVAQQVLATVAVVAAIQFLQWFVKRAKLVQAVNRLPGPGLSESGTSHFLLGHAYRPLQTYGSIPNKPNSPHGLPIQKEYTARFQKDGIYRLWVFHPHTVPFAFPLVYVTDPRFVSQLLERTTTTTTTTNNRSNKKYAQQHLIICKEKRVLKLADALIGDSFFALPDDSPEWKHQRKLFLGFFSQTILEETVRISTGILQDFFFDKWDKNKNNEHGGAVVGIEMEEWSSRLTMEVLGLVGLGYSFGSLLSYDSEEKPVDDDDSLYNLYSTLMATITRRFNAPPWAQYLPNEENRIFSRGSHRLNSVMHDVIQKRLEEQIQSEQQNEGRDESSSSPHGNTKRRKDLLSRLLLKDEQGERLPYKYILGNVRGFIFAGHDTTSSVLSYALWCLATNPHVMKRLQTEVDELFESIVAPGRDESPTYNQLRNLRYLDAVIKETLRLNAPAPIGRASLEDIPLQSSNNNKTYVIPKGVTIIIQPSLIHTSRAHWKDAETFCPERFLESSTTANKNNNKSFFPFSMGPRHCVGEQLALAELKNILAHMVRRYDLQPNEHAVTPMLFMQFTIKPHEVLLDITPRCKKAGWKG